MHVIAYRKYCHGCVFEVVLEMIGVTIRPLAKRKKILLAGDNMEKFNPLTATK